MLEHASGGGRHHLYRRLLLLLRKGPSRAFPPCTPVRFRSRESNTCPTAPASTAFPGPCTKRGTKMGQCGRFVPRTPTKATLWAAINQWLTLAFVVEFSGRTPCKAVYAGSIPTQASIDSPVTAPVAKLVDAWDLKSPDRKVVPVRVRPGAPEKPPSGGFYVSAEPGRYALAASIRQPSGIKSPQSAASDAHTRPSSNACNICSH